jgi:TetR/AcrR family transcriptional regulator
MAARSGERRLQILQTLASMLENPRSEKVTTAALAGKLDVSEAALYRHFASKAQMYEGSSSSSRRRSSRSSTGLPTRAPTASRKPSRRSSCSCRSRKRIQGMTRVLIGEALVNEDERLQARINQLTDKLEAALRQSLRIAQAANGWHGDAQGRRGRAHRLRAGTLAALRQERLQAHAAGWLGAATQVPVR